MSPTPVAPLPQGLLLTVEGETYLPSITKVFEDLTLATERIPPGINSKKFMVGICPSIKALLPANWPKHSDDLHHYVRDCVETSDIDMLQKNELDCLIRTRGGPSRDYAMVIIPNASHKQDLHFVCRSGLADCAQSKAIINDLIRQLG